MADVTLNTTFDKDQRYLTELVVGVRQDTVPANAEDRLAGDGKFHPLVFDRHGNVRAVLPDDAPVRTQELEVLREILAIMNEVRDMVRQIV